MADIMALYRPVSSTVQQQFHDELGSLLEHVATFQVPVYITGDFNVRVDRSDVTQVVANGVFDFTHSRKVVYKVPPTFRRPPAIFQIILL